MNQRDLKGLEQKHISDQNNNMQMPLGCNICNMMGLRDSEKSGVSGIEKREVRLEDRKGFGGWSGGGSSVTR